MFIEKNLKAIKILQKIFLTTHLCSIYTKNFYFLKISRYFIAVLLNYFSVSFTLPGSNISFIHLHEAWVTLTDCIFSFNFTANIWNNKFDNKYFMLQKTQPFEILLMSHLKHIINWDIVQINWDIVQISVYLCLAKVNGLA